MKDRKILIILLMFIVFCSVFMWTGLNHTVNNTKININNASMMNDSWRYKGEEITLPINIDVPAGKAVSISRYLPYILGDNEYLCVLSAEQAIEVYIDHELIYKSGYDKADKMIEMPGDVYNIVKLPERAVGKKITIKYISQYEKHSGEFNEIYYGTKGDIILNILKHGIYKIVIILLLNIGALVCFIYLFIYRRKERAKNFAYLGIFCMMIGIWVLLESGLTQFIFGNQHLVKVGSYFCIMLAPIPLNLFFKNIIGSKYYRSCNIFINAYMINFAISFILGLIKKDIFQNIQIFTHIIILLNSIMAFYVTIDRARKEHSKRSKNVLLCMAPILIAAILEIIKYYKKTLIYDTTNSFVVGITFSMIFIAILMLIDVIGAYKKAKDAKVLNLLAFQDTITKGRNRTAFYRDINIMQSKEKSENLCIMVLDMNNLKKVNDKYGHMAGDDAIRLCYTCIKNSLADLGTCYRIGGDEFTCICTNFNEQLILKFLSEFQMNVAASNKNVKYDFNVAYGYAFYNKNMDANLMDTFNRADKKMYLRKKAMKESAAEYSL